MIARDLEPEDFPFTIICLAPGGVPVWGVTVFKPPPGTRVPLHIPGLAREYGPITVKTINGQGIEAQTGPYYDA